jgi:SAM-dependent methyltransferase
VRGTGSQGLTGEAWYDDRSAPAALLRAELRLHHAWILSTLASKCPPVPQRILDLGCGGGLVANALGRAGHQVTAIDPSRENLRAAARHDRKATVRYLPMNLGALAFQDDTFDVVCATSLLGGNPDLILGEASRVLRGGGLLFFRALNATAISRLMAGRWGLPLPGFQEPGFLDPGVLRALCARLHLKVEILQGLRPPAGDILRFLLTGSVRDTCRFSLTPSLLASYFGQARKAHVCCD